MLTKVDEYAAMFVQPSKMVRREDKLLLCSTNKRHVAIRTFSGQGQGLFAFNLPNGVFGMAVHPITSKAWVSLGGLEHKVMEIDGTGMVLTPNSERPGEICFDGAGNLYWAPFRAGAQGNPGNVYKDDITVPVYEGGQVIALAADDEGSLYVGDPGANSLVKLDAAGAEVTRVLNVRPVEILVADLELFVLMADRSIWRMKRDDLAVTGFFDAYDTPPLAATALAMDDIGRIHLSGMTWPAINGIYPAWIFEVTG